MRAAVASAPDALTAVRSVLLEVLPLTDESIVDTRVGAAFLIRALGDAALCARYRERNAEFVALLAASLTTARDEGMLDRHHEPGDVAVELYALVNVLEEPLLLGDLTPAPGHRDRRRRAGPAGGVTIRQPSCGATSDATRSSWSRSPRSRVCR